jgi:16S rRNA U1498 N3-methylase RsmE
MQKYFITKENLENRVITGDDAYQMSTVLRFKGDEIVMVSDSEKSYLAKILNVSKDEVSFEIVEEKTGNMELPVFVSIF